MGTAQFGMPYGIANKTGQPDRCTVTDIVRQAWQCGIREFDTAQGYGESEALLGEAFSDLGIAGEVKVISKFSPQLNYRDARAVIGAFELSLERLRVPYLLGMLLHREELLPFWNDGLSRILGDLVSSGKVRHLGISVYSPGAAIKALETEGIDFVQLPTSILDRRFKDRGVFDLADKKGKKIYIRSVFLQGLILLPSEEIPSKLERAKPVIEELESLCRSLKVTRQEMALRFVKSEMPNAKIVFGADSPQHVKKNVETWEKLNDAPPVDLSGKLMNVDESILMPSLWA